MSDVMTVQTPMDRAGRTARWVVIGMLVLFGVLAGRVAQLIYWPDARIAALAHRRERTAQVHSRRGGILDRQGRVLAASRMARRLYVDPQEIEDLSVTLGRLAELLEVQTSRLQALVEASNSRRYVVLAPVVTDEQARQIRGLNIHGVGLEPVVIREYPHGALAGQIIGFTGVDETGLEGIEYTHDSALSNQDGMMKMIRDSAARPLARAHALAFPKNGRDIMLSLDLNIQAIAERQLAKSCEKFEADHGAAVVLDVKTGQILALANWPAFDPSLRGNVDADIRRNRVVTDVFEPGSIFKPIVYAAALEGQFTWPSETIDCTTSGLWRTPFGRRLRDAHGCGLLSADGVLIKSSNIGMGQFGLRMGVDYLSRMVDRFGFGHSTESGLVGEIDGLVNPVSQWNDYSLTSIPMGQEIAITALQIAQAYTVFANDGVMVKPRIYARDAARPVRRGVISSGVARHVRYVLRHVVTEGTGRRAKSDQYRIWGKTGTAQVARTDGRGYLPQTYTASFVCGAPLDDPRIVVAVVVHRPNPRKGHYGGTVAGPYAKQIVEQTLAYLGVPADAHLDEQKPAHQQPWSAPRARPAYRLEDR